MTPARDEINAFSFECMSILRVRSSGSGIATPVAFRSDIKGDLREGHFQPGGRISASTGDVTEDRLDSMRTFLSCRATKGQKTKSKQQEMEPRNTLRYPSKAPQLCPSSLLTTRDDSNSKAAMHVEKRAVGKDEW